MSVVARESRREEINFQQIVSLVLSMYVLGALAVETLLKLGPESVELLDRIDFFICFFFLYDFSTRFYAAENKWKFMRWGWLDLISSIPFWGGFQWARLARLIRILRALRSIRVLISYLFIDRSRGALFTAILTGMIMMIFSSIAILNFETTPDSKIKDPGDALWWAFTTISTVGYGDVYPVTTEGRLVAVFLIIAGVGLFCVYTAFIASLFVAENTREENAEIKQLLEEVRQLRSEVAALKPHLNGKTSEAVPLGSNGTGDVRSAVN